MRICFDIEVGHHEAFKFGIDRKHATVWEDLDGYDFEFLAATVFLAQKHTYRSFGRGDISKLCAVVAGADKVITYNGKLWDVPVIGLHVERPRLRQKLRRLTGEVSDSPHDDLCQIAAQAGAPWGTTLDALASWNFGPERMVQWQSESEAYQFELMNEGWDRRQAYKASQAWEDAGMTYALWERWQSGELVTSPRRL